VSELDWNGRLLVVYNTHLESRSYGRIQWHQLQEILADLRQYGSNTPCILGGDLNTKYWPSFYVKKLEAEGFQSATGKRIIRSHKIAMALDWIFVKGPIDLEGGEVNRGYSGSDHYPVTASARHR
jgi:endonuclease/exonuclease/phosphatase family metal-dependent hydrolase